ncbi:MAG: GTPase Era [Syntrophales bacterium]|nr:GTPase Era [Syntrophales bacterium]MDY0043774.1 GTPase Era [Syntrophales bacterium]
MFKSGFIGIIGSPNVGKSTLLNFIIGEKIAITTRKPQTTRNRITGIKNIENGQFIFVDTPGIHKGTSSLNEYMVATAISTLSDSDLILLLIDAAKKFDQPDLNDRYILGSLENVAVPVFLVINKVDLVQKEMLLPLIDMWKDFYSFSEIIPLSAATGFNVDTLLGKIRDTLPEGPPYFPEDLMTDMTERFLAQEIIREKITLLSHQEIPYSTAVTVDTFKEIAEKNLVRIQATITVAKNSQKGILIGKRGEMLKRIGTRARLEMEKFFGTRIYLELFVRVSKDWTEDSHMMSELGYKIK